MDDELAKTIGIGMRRARHANDLTQEQVAELLGVSSEFYARVERGHALPSVGTLVNICYSLDVSADLLLYGDDKAGMEWPGHESTESPEVQRLIRHLRRAQPRVVRIVALVLAHCKGRGEPTAAKAIE